MSSAVQDTLDPHLIVQYPAGTRVRVGDVELVAPHPNRVIYANDPPHRELRIAADLPDALRTADVFLLSSFNVIQDPATLESRLAQVRDAMRALPPDALVVFEDAGYHVPALSRRVRDEMVWSADIYSLNEDEMQAYLGRTVDLLDAPTRREGRPGAARGGPGADAGGAHQVLGAGGRCSGRPRSGRRWSAGSRWRAPATGWATGSRPRTTRRRPSLTPGTTAQRLVSDVADLLGSDACVVPALDLTGVATPTTIGLGDSFVGGFLAALDRR